MAGYTDREQYEGTWRGVPVSFTRSFSGRRLTDAECGALCAGEDVELAGLTNRKGETYSAVCRLGYRDGRGRRYVGVTFRRGVPETLCGHTFTEAERAELLAGGSVSVSGMTGRQGKPFDAVLSYDRDTDEIHFSYR